MLTEQVYANETISTAEKTGWKLVCLSKFFFSYDFTWQRICSKIGLQAIRIFRAISWIFLPQKLVFELKAF